MVFGMPTLLELPTFDDNIAFCRKLGLDFIEINMNFPEYHLDFLKNTAYLCEKKAESGLFFTIHLDENLNPADTNPLAREAYHETVRRVIRTAKAIGAPLINMHMHHGIFVTLPDRKTWIYDRDFGAYEAAYDAFRILCEEEIGGSGIRISIENTDGFRSFEKEIIGRLLESPVFSLTWDIGHSKAEGEHDLPFLYEHQDRLKHFHIHDGCTEPPKNHLALGDGMIDLHDRLDLAASLDARCVLETKTAAALEKSVSWLTLHGYR